MLKKHFSTVYPQKCLSPPQKGMSFVRNLSQKHYFLTEVQPVGMYQNIESIGSMNITFLMNSIVLRFMSQSKEFMVKFCVFNYFTELLRKHVSKIKNIS